MLYLVSTPIGNLKDITLRALEILQSVDAIICEDTRRTSILLNAYSNIVIRANAGIQLINSRSELDSRFLSKGQPSSGWRGNDRKKSLIILNDYNESKIVPSILERLKSGENLALVSDAGTPLISDPGYKLIRLCLENNIQVDSIPGPSSVITALTLSGLPPDKFLFLGYPPEKPGHRKDWLKSLCDIKDITIIIFISPHKMLRVLEEIRDAFGDIEVVLAHELTKIHQSVDNKKISEWLETLKYPKGEYVLLFRLNP